MSIMPMSVPPAVMICQRCGVEGASVEVALDLLVPPPDRGDVVAHGGLVQLEAELAVGWGRWPQRDACHATACSGRSDQDTVAEDSSGADHCNQVRGVDRPPAVLGCLDELEHIGLHDSPRLSTCILAVDTAVTDHQRVQCPSVLAQYG